MTHDAVVITGASTGIGKAMVHYFAAKGVQVFAAVRDLSTVDDHALVTPIRLDVTSDSEAKAAAELVQESVTQGQLRAIINNAGVVVGGPLEYVELDEVRRQFDVNVVGQLAVTQAFLPLLRDHETPRIVFTGSIGGRMAVPFIGPYAASKHALNGMAEALRRELLPWGFGVSVLAPATVATPIWDKAGNQIDDIEKGLTPEALERYNVEIGAMRRVSSDARQAGIPPEDVAKAAWNAVFAKRPKAEYLIRFEAKSLAKADVLVPTALFDRVVRRQLGMGGLRQWRREP